MKTLLKIITTCSLMLFVTSPAFADSDNEITEVEETATEKMEDIEAAKAALDAGDYDAWADAVEGRKITEIINEDNFDDFLEAHELKQNGEVEAAKEIFEELGFKPIHKKRFKENKQRLHRQSVIEALDAGDYDAWLDAVGEDAKVIDFINEDNFDDLLEAHGLIKDGDKEAAKEILEELGLKHPRKHFNKK